MNCSVVRAKTHHADPIAPLFAAYRAFYGQPPDEDGARAFIRERLEREESVIFVAISGEGERAACEGFTQLYPAFSSVRIRRIWILNDLFVAPASRGQGLGRRLMEAAHEFARSTGAAKVELATARDNGPAKALYASLGYELDRAFDRYELLL